MLIIQTITPMKALKYIDKVFLRGKLAVDDGKLVQEKLGTYIKRGLRQPLA